MVKIKLQFFGGRGARSSSRNGGGNLNPGDILSTTSLVSYREEDPRLVDDTLGVFKDVYDKYGFVIQDIQLAQLSPNSPALAYYDGANVAINQNYFNDRMEQSYDRCVASGFHPGRGSKTAIEAVTAHELGHALTDAAGRKLNASGIQDAATRIVNEARRITGDRGVVQMAEKISRYATTNNAEAIAEAYADTYCNGSRAKAQSKAIVQVLEKYLK